MLQFPPFSLKTLLHSALWSVWARAASKACAGSAVLPRVNTSLLCLWLVPFTAISPCHCQGPQTHRITSFTQKTGILKTLFYWGIVGLQCCVNVCYTAQWLSYTYICVFFILFSIVIYHGILNIVGPCWLSTLYMIVCTCCPQHPVCPFPDPHPLGSHQSVQSVCDFFVS